MLCYFQQHHRHHHHHHHHQGPAQRQDSRSQSSHDTAGDGGDSQLNGEHRGSQRGRRDYVRRESFEQPQRSLDSPRPQRSLDLHRALDLHRGSLDHMSTSVRESGHHPAMYQRQDSYPVTRDDYSIHGYARELPSQYPDVSQIHSVQVTPRPKPRAFPRTNPAYVGVSRRDGQPSYKRINIEQPQPPTAIYNQ